MYIKNTLFNIKNGVITLKLLARLAMLLPLQLFSPNKKRKFNYTLRRWSNRAFRKRFRDINQFEYWMIDNIVWHDEYDVADLSFRPTDVIIDIGAHIGIFSYLCYLRGSRNINSFEPEPNNIKSFQSNLGDLDGITLFPQAVFRSDIAPTNSLVQSGFFGENTGINNIMMGGNIFDFVSQKAISPTNPPVKNVRVIALDEILSKFERMRLLKIDCEGSEFPILMTSKLLRRVDRIVGEYHEISIDAMMYLDSVAKIPEIESFQVSTLLEKLEQEGFRVKSTYSEGSRGIFDAINSRVS